MGHSQDERRLQLGWLEVLIDSWTGPADTRPVNEEIALVKILLLAMAVSVFTGCALQWLYAKKAAWEKLSHIAYQPYAWTQRVGVSFDGTLLGTIAEPHA